MASSPVLLNDKLKVLSYDGQSFGTNAQYAIDNVLVPTADSFHCSGQGVGFTLVLQASEVFTATHLLVRGPGARCTEPIKSGVVWVSEEAPNVEVSKKVTTMTQAQFDADVSDDKPDLFFQTDPESREIEIELPKWIEGKYFMIKFLDTHNQQENLDVAVVAAAGFWGRKKAEHRPLGSWFHRHVRNNCIHPHKLTSTFSPGGWACDGRDFSGGCRGGFSSYFKSTTSSVTFRCKECGFDLCDACAADPLLGRLSPASIAKDLAALDTKTQSSRRILRQLRRVPESLDRYLQHGLLARISQILEKEDKRPKNARVGLQLMSEIVGQLFSPDFEAGDLVWAFTDKWAQCKIKDPAAEPMVLEEGQVAKKLVWKMVNDEEIMMSTASLYEEVSKEVVDMDKVIRLVEQCDPLAVNALGENVLAGAVRSGKVEVVEALLKGVQFADGFTRSLEIAVEANRADIAKLLTNAGASGYSVDRSKLSTEMLEAVPEVAYKSRKMWCKEFTTTALKTLLTLRCDEDSLGVMSNLIAKAPLEDIKACLVGSVTEFHTMLSHLFCSDNILIKGVDVMVNLLEKHDEQITRFIQCCGGLRFAKRADDALGTCDKPQKLINILEPLPSEIPASVQDFCGLLSRGDANGLIPLRTALRRKMSLEEPITHYVLEKAGTAETLENFLTGVCVIEGNKFVKNSGVEARWQNFNEIFQGDDLENLLALLQQVISFSETLPVVRLRRERGLKALTDPISVKFKAPADVWRPEVGGIRVEPFVSLSTLKQSMLATMPVADTDFLKKCHSIVGYELETEEGTCVVKDFQITTGLNLPVHTLQYSGDKTARVILSIHEGVVGDLKQQEIHDLVAQHATFRMDVCAKKIKMSPGDFKEEGERMKKAGEVPEGLEYLLCTEVKEVANADNQRIHSVVIHVSEEIPFELAWPMVRNEVVTALRALPRRVWSEGMMQMETAVHSGIASNGQGPIARGLYKAEAQQLFDKVSKVIQASIIEDRSAAAAPEAHPGLTLAARLQFQREDWKKDDWRIGQIVEVNGDQVTLVDDKGVLNEVPASKVKTPKNQSRSSLGSRSHSLRSLLSSVGLSHGFRGLRSPSSRPRGERPPQHPAAIRDDQLRRVLEAAEAPANMAGAGPDMQPIVVMQMPQPGQPGQPQALVQQVHVQQPGQPNLNPPLDQVPVNIAQAPGGADEDGALAAGSTDMLDRIAELTRPDRFISPFQALGGQLQPIASLDANAVPAPPVEPPRAIPGRPSLLGDDFPMHEFGDDLIQLVDIEDDEDDEMDDMDDDDLSGDEDDEEDDADIEATDIAGEAPALNMAMVPSMFEEVFMRPRAPRAGARGSGQDEMDTEGDLGGIMPHQRLLEDLFSRRGQPQLVQILSSDGPSWLGDSSQRDKKNDVVRGGFEALRRATDASSLAASLDHPIVGRFSADSCPDKKPAPRGPIIPVSVMDHDENSTVFNILKRTDGKVTLEGTHEISMEVALSERDVEPAAKKRKICRDEDAQMKVPKTEISDRLQACFSVMSLLHQQSGQPNGKIWLSKKLDKKLSSQLDDVLSVACNDLPDWVSSLPQKYPFLFSAKSRKNVLKYTAFGLSFAVHWIQQNAVGELLRRRVNVQTELTTAEGKRMQDLSQELSNIEDHVVRSHNWLGALNCVLLRTCKGDDLLTNAQSSLENMADRDMLKNMLEVQFDGESGFGSAVTKNFFVEICKALQHREQNTVTPMWVNDSEEGDYLSVRRGLMIRPLPEKTPDLNRVLDRFRFLGRVMGMALREGYFVPLPLTEDFFKLLKGERMTYDSLPRPGSGMTGEFLGFCADFMKNLEIEKMTPEQRKALPADRLNKFLTADNNTMTQCFSEYCADAYFLETGFGGAELCEDGENKSVTPDNVAEFVRLGAKFWFQTGIERQMAAFKQGISSIFPLQQLMSFSASELRDMFCGEETIEWDEKSLLARVYPMGELKADSPTYQFLIKVMLDMDNQERSKFLDFVTSCPRLPPGGMSKFRMDVHLEKQGRYPRSRACANQLFLPVFESKEHLHEMLTESMMSSTGHHEHRGGHTPQ